MRKKDVIRLIKTESKKVEIKDFQSEILAKVRHLKPVETLEKPKLQWRLKPVYLGLLGAMVFILMFTIFYQPAAPINPVTPNLEIYDEAIALSTISSASLIAIADSELSSSSGNMLLALLQNQPHEPKIMDEISDIGKYMEIMEKLLASQNQLDIEKEIISEPQFNRSMQFKTQDLLQNEVLYQIRYKQEIDMVKDEFTLTGEIELGSVKYQMVAIGNIQSQNRLVYRIYKDEANFIGVTFIKNDQAARYTTRIHKDGILVETVEMTTLELNNKQAIQIKFVTGQSVGTYQFVIDTENEQKVIRTQYEIQGDETESGIIIVRVLTEPSGYEFFVQPTGRPPFTINRGREMSENRGRPNLPIFQ